MTGINYERLISVRLTHNFFESGLCREDMTVVPTEETERTMKNNNMVFKNDGEGFRIFYKTLDPSDTSNKTPLTDMKDVTLRFALTLKNPEQFLGVTELSDSQDVNYTNGKKAYFTNRNTQDDIELEYKIINQCGSSPFTYNVPVISDGGVGLFVGITNSSGTDVSTLVPDSANAQVDANGHYYFTFDPGKLPNGMYTVISDNSSDAPVTDYVLVDNTLAKQNIFGIIDIFIESMASGKRPTLAGNSGYTPPAPIPDAAADYTYDVRFTRKESKWKYVIVYRSNQFDFGDTYTLTDGGGNQAPYTSGGIPLSFGSATGSTYNGYDAKIFETSALIPFFETPKKGIVLNNTTDSVVVFNNMPGPLSQLSGYDATTQKSTIIVYI